MKVKSDFNTKIINWNTNFGLFELTLIDNKLEDLRFCRNGSSLDHGLYASCNDLDFIKKVHECLTELLNYLKENPTPPKRSEI